MLDLFHFSSLSSSFLQSTLQNMALSFSQFPFCPSKATSAKPTFSFPTTSNSFKPPTVFASKPLKLAKFTKASQEKDNNTTTSDNAAGPIDENQPQNDEMADLGAEIKKAMKERDQSGNMNFLSGVAEEIREIEWPSINKVLGITGVVLGMIAGSSVVLLTLNAVLAELSDRVFAGKGVQDFFG